MGYSLGAVPSACSTVGVGGWVIVVGFVAYVRYARHGAVGSLLFLGCVPLCVALFAAWNYASKDAVSKSTRHYALRYRLLVSMPATMR